MKKKYWDPYIPKYKKTLKAKEPVASSSSYIKWTGTIESIEHSVTIKVSKCHIYEPLEEIMEEIEWVANIIETGEEENSRLYQEEEDKHHW